MVHFYTEYTPVLYRVPRSGTGLRYGIRNTEYSKTRALNHRTRPLCPPIESVSGQQARFGFDFLPSPEAKHWQLDLLQLGGKGAKLNITFLHPPPSALINIATKLTHNHNHYCRCHTSPGSRNCPVPHHRRPLTIMPSAAPLTNGTPISTTSVSPPTNGSIAKDGPSANDNIRRFVAPSRPLSPRGEHTLFHNKTRCFVYGLQPRAVQGMLDFDFICKRTTPSVAGIIYTFGGQFVSKMYWGTSETLLPVYQDVQKAMAKHDDVDTIVNFASSRSVYSSTMELMEYPQIKSIAIIAEGVPERRAREILYVAKKKGITIIGPATVGGIKPGAFKIGNTGGMMDNIVASKLYRKGSVGYVSKSGGMSNELNNIVSETTDGVYEGVAIGGDRYPGTTFIDHMLRYQADPECKLLLLLGEVGGVEEYRVVEAVKDGTITKPVVAWAIGTCASMFKTEVQFGHAGSFANSQLETAAMKNKMMREAGIYVPNTFEEMPKLLSDVYQKMVKEGTIKPQPEPVPPKIPIDYSWAQELGLIRKPAAFISTISDDRGQELLYAGMPISDVFREEIGIGGVMSLLWFRRRLPDYASRFLEMVLMLTADHGPAVSGAMNTIITTRAGKDLISALVSGLLTIGSRFGGALDGAAEEFTKAFDKGLSPRDFVDIMRKENKLIPGIGHKVKSRANPDLRVELVKEFVKKRFPSCKMLDYAIAVETVTTSKKDNLILNVDGCVAVCFVDLLRNCGAFSPEEAEDYLSMGVLNGLFVLGRSIGLIAHYLDQKRLRTGLYRHPWDDITYLLPTLAAGAPGNEGRVEVSL
ncbi:MAG: ATP-citrate synthase subunit 1 [Lasallia pustulata]|uniref:ATP citrate synthase n=2 Tax=Lasallia pustulata TaxID=136370 RepID=A0A5M8PD58_9LECA|nr:MAG: ATP-citrate synthase subunit 1 [Lasallia pustulata]